MVVRDFAGPPLSPRSIQGRRRRATELGFQNPLSRMAAFHNDAVERYILEHVKTIVRKEDDDVPITRLQRQLEQLPARTLGRFQPSVDSLRLAVQKFPGAVYINEDGRVHSCAKPSTTSRTAPPVNHAAKPLFQETPKSGSSAKIVTEGKITAPKERNYGFITIRRPSQYAFYHLSATSQWSTGSRGPKVVVPAAIEFEGSPPGHKYNHVANAARYAGVTLADAKELHRPYDKRVISDRLGVITFIRPDHGVIRFRDKGGESSFFDKKIVLKQLLRHGETVMDVSSVWEKVCFEAQPNHKGDGLVRWYDEALSSVQHGGGSVVFDDDNSLCFAQRNSASEQRASKLYPPRTGVASQSTQSSCWDGAEHALADKQRQSHATPQELNFEVQLYRERSSSEKAASKSSFTREAVPEFGGV